MGGRGAKAGDPGDNHGWRCGCKCKKQQGFPGGMGNNSRRGERLADWLGSVSEELGRAQFDPDAGVGAVPAYLGLNCKYGCQQAQDCTERENPPVPTRSPIAHALSLPPALIQTGLGPVCCAGDGAKRAGAESRLKDGGIGAEEGTRTPTPLRVHGPEPCASANSATSARVQSGPGGPTGSNSESRKRHSACQIGAMSAHQPDERVRASSRECSSRAFSCPGLLNEAVGHARNVVGDGAGESLAGDEGAVIVG